MSIKFLWIDLHCTHYQRPIKMKTFQFNIHKIIDCKTVASPEIFLDYTQIMRFASTKLCDWKKNTKFFLIKKHRKTKWLNTLNVWNEHSNKFDSITKHVRFGEKSIHPKHANWFVFNWVSRSKESARTNNKQTDEITFIFLLSNSLLVRRCRCLSLC